MTTRDQILIRSDRLGEKWSQEFFLQEPREEKKVCVLFATHMPKETHLQIHLIGEGSRAELYFGVVGRGSNSFNIQVDVHHKGVNSFGRVFANAALFDESRFSFHTLLDISQEAQGSDTYFLGKARMMSEKSRGEFFPYLQIKTSDVKASHGSSVGKIRDKDIFYLQSRGMNRERAKEILLASFFRDIARAFPKEERKVLFQYE